jgi:hypothetical protein
MTFFGKKFPTLQNLPKVHPLSPCAGREFTFFPSRLIFLFTLLIYRGIMGPSDTQEDIMKIGDLAYMLIEQGKSDDEVLAEIHKTFPSAKTGLNSIKWYRSQLRKRATKKEKKANKQAKAHWPSKKEQTGSYSLRNIKLVRGMEGDSYNVDLIDPTGRKVAFVSFPFYICHSGHIIHRYDEGSGGEPHFEWIDTPMEKAFVEWTHTQDPWVSEWDGKKNRMDPTIWIEKELNKANKQTKTHCPPKKEQTGSYSLRNIKVFRGRDGHGYNVDLIDPTGRKVAFVYDEGCGGEPHFEWVDHKSPRVEVHTYQSWDDKKRTYNGTPMEKAFVEWTHTQDPWVSEWDGKKNRMEPAIWIEDELNRAEFHRHVRRICSPTGKIVYFIVPEKKGIIMRMNGGSKFTRQQQIEWITKRYKHGVTILHGMRFEEALRIIKEHNGGEKI